MAIRSAGRTVGLLILLVLTTGVVGGAIHLSAAVEAPLRVMGSRAEASRVDASFGADLPRGTAPAVEIPDPRTGVWAVVVGIDDYPGSGRDLRAGVADALDMAATLDHYGVPADHRQVLLDGAATRDAVVRALDWLAANAGPKATAVFFFSGHVREVHGDPDGDGEETDETMVFADDGLMTDGELKGVLDRTQARRQWVAMAGCFAGGFDDIMAPGRLLTGASPEGSLAYENDRFDRTYLVEYMLRRAILQGSAPNSIQDAFNWATDALRKDYPIRLPVMFDQLGEPLVLSAA
ncbi:MAG TPA: caspase family protein [Acidimicrobiia bacterium]|nr:caspase family protein [Acidimicrobiia bacterium]